MSHSGVGTCGLLHDAKCTLAITLLSSTAASVPERKTRNHSLVITFIIIAVRDPQYKFSSRILRASHTLARVDSVVRTRTGTSNRVQDEGVEDELDVI